jgi:ligand-binding SRPBCC domain-containing protein
MPTFRKSVVVEAPVEAVFGFHEREDALPLVFVYRVRSPHSCFRASRTSG